MKGFGFYRDTLSKLAGQSQLQSMCCTMRLANPVAGPVAC
jgi:hypothetical protein